MLVFEYDPVTAGVPASGSVTSGCINVTVLPVWLTEYTLLPATIFPGPVTVCPIATFTRFVAVVKVISLPAADAAVVNVPPNDIFPPTRLELFQLSYVQYMYPHLLFETQMYKKQ